MKRVSWKRSLIVGWGVSGATALSFGGCEQHADEFREAAGSTVKDGVNTLLDGFVDGVFAVVEPDDEGDDGGGA